MNINMSSQEEFENSCEKLSGHEFEDVIADLFEKVGFETKVTQKSNDGGIDVKLYESDKEEYAIGHHYAIVQVKKSEIGSQTVHRLAGAATYREVDKLVLISLRGFSQSASDTKELISTHSNLDTIFLDGGDLYNLYAGNKNPPL